jgi:hypothetical protein
VTRWPVAAFVALAIATVGAFFVTQHLKVTTPLINGYPAPVPSTINPENGGTCAVAGPKGVVQELSFKRMRISFYLQGRSDNVDVYIVDSDQRVIRTLPGSGIYMRVKQRHRFTWNGREDDGRIAPDGSYEIQVALVHQGRKLTIATNSGVVEPVTVQTHPPALVVTSVTPAVLTSGAGSQVMIRYAGNQGLRPRVLILRGGSSKVLKNYAATARNGTSLWNGTLAGGLPAPPGEYLVALRLSPDRTCNRVQSPVTVAAAPHALVTVR